MTEFIVAVFVVADLGTVLGGLPLSQLDRTGVALPGAIALIGVNAALPPLLDEGDDSLIDPPLNRWQTAKGLAVAAGIAGCFLLAPWPREVVALTGAGVLLRLGQSM